MPLKIPLLFFLVVLFSWGCRGQSTSVTTITINPHNPESVYIATNDKVFKTRDGGGTWEEIIQGIENARVISLAVHPEQPTTIYAGTFGTAVFRTRSAGNRWFPLNAGMKEHVAIVNQFLFQPDDPNIMFAATTVGIFNTTDGGEMWHEMENKGMDSVYVVSLVQDPRHLDTLYAGTSGGVYKTTNRSERWANANNGMIEGAGKPGTALSLGVNSLVMDPDNSKVLYAGTTNGAFKTIDGGKNWIKNGKELKSVYVSVFVLNPRNPRELFAGTQKGLFFSDNGGETWVPRQNGLTNVNIRSLAIHPENPEILYAGTQNGLFKTKNGGKVWENVPFLPGKDAK